MIDWGKYFDKIFCLVHCRAGEDPKTTRRFRECMSEMQRVGLLGHSKFSFSWTFEESDRLRKPIIDLLPGVSRCPAVPGAVEPVFPRDPGACAGLISIGIATLQALREANAQGFSRILWLEDDVRFLKDLSQIEVILENLPDRDLCIMDRLLPPGKSTQSFAQDVRGNAINNWFYEKRHLRVTAGGCTAISKKGVQKLLRLMSSTNAPPSPLDFYYPAFPDAAVCVRQLVVQAPYRKAITVSRVPKDCYGPFFRRYYWPMTVFGYDITDYALPVGASWDTDCVDDLPDSTQNRELHVFYVMDGKTIVQLLISLYSLWVTSAPGTQLRVTVLTDGPLPEDATKLLTGFFNHARVVFQIVDGSSLYDTRLSVARNWTCGHLSRSTWGRLLIPEVTDAKKVLYLDTDTIIRRDLSGLFGTDLHGAAFGAPMDNLTAGITDDASRRLAMTQRGYVLPEGQPILCLGIMLIDVPKFREHKFLDRCLAYMNDGKPKSHDQVVINNILSKNEAALLPQTANPKRYFQAATSNSEVDDAIYNEVVIDHLYGDKARYNKHGSIRKELEGFYQRALSVCLAGGDNSVVKNLPFRY